MRWLILAAACAAITGSALLVRGASEPPRSKTSTVNNIIRDAFISEADATRITLPAKVQVLDKGRDLEQPIKSLLRIERPMKYGDWQWNDDKVPAGRLWVRVDLAAQTMSIFRAGHEIGSTVILYGAPEKPSPIGEFKILRRIKNHRSAQYGAPMPFTLRLTWDGIAIHASDVRDGRATHGCIGVPAAFAERLYEEAGLGDDVTIT